MGVPTAPKAPKIEPQSGDLRPTRPARDVPGSWSFYRGDFYQVCQKFEEECFPRGLKRFMGAWYKPTEIDTWVEVPEAEMITTAMAWGDRQFWREANGRELKIPMGDDVAQKILKPLVSMRYHHRAIRQRGVRLLDGMLDPLTRELTPFRLEDFVTTTLPFKSSDVRGDPVTWLNFIPQGFRPQDVQLLKEWFGYCIEPGNHYKKVLWLYGDASNGKSIIVKVLIALLGGDEAIVTRKSHNFQSEFNADLKDKALIYFQDFRDGGREDGRMLNFVLTVSGNDPVPIRDLYKAAVTDRLPGKILYASNLSPQFKDPSKAMYDRLLTVHRGRRPGAKDPGLEAKLLAELPAILGWALDGLADLRRRDGFDENMLDQKLRGFVARQTNPVHAFVEDCLDVDLVANAESVEKKMDIFQAWLTYAEKTSHHRNFSMETFWAPLFQAVQEVGGKLKQDHNPKFLWGVKLRVQDTEEVPQGRKA